MNISKMLLKNNNISVILFNKQYCSDKVNKHKFSLNNDKIFDKPFFNFTKYNDNSIKIC
jgi:hypothetical protein